MSVADTSQETGLLERAAIVTRCAGLGVAACAGWAAGTLDRYPRARMAAVVTGPCRCVVALREGWMLVATASPGRSGGCRLDPTLLASALYACAVAGRLGDALASTLGVRHGGEVCPVNIAVLGAAIEDVRCREATSTTIRLALAALRVSSLYVDVGAGLLADAAARAVEIITAHAGRCAQVAAVAAMLDRTELGGVNPAGTPPAGREVADCVVEAVTTGNVTWRDHHPDSPYAGRDDGNWFGHRGRPVADRSGIEWTEVDR
jgi:hypothetical protein